jgi:autoinducer 2 (AI-2) kinase
MKRSGYLIFDIGTGNMRVAVVTVDGEVLAIERRDMEYHSDSDNGVALSFVPEVVWDRLVRMARKALQIVGDVTIEAITCTSQREGIVLFDHDGNHVIGLPNIDNRGRHIVDLLEDPQGIYEQTGRWPTHLFSATKLASLKVCKPEIWKQVVKFTSISDWVTYLLSGELVYEPSQATETLLFDVNIGRWSETLADVFNLSLSICPPLAKAGTVLGDIRPEMADALGIGNDVKVIVGGADTQVAVKNVTSSVGDVIIVSGTTTPIVQIVDKYLYDENARTWTNQHIETGQWILEGNCGVTGLNYQKIKDLFYPTEGYDQMEREMDKLIHHHIIASLGTNPIDGERVPPQTGGFVFNTPLPQNLSRAHFAWACLFDVACAIKASWIPVEETTGRKPNFMWGCGGGFQSVTLRQLLAELLDVEIRVKSGAQHATVLGAAKICNEALGRNRKVDESIEIVRPEGKHDYDKMYREWRDWRTALSRPKIESFR